jgi:protein-tyrosine phosphatase
MSGVQRSTFNVQRSTFKVQSSKFKVQSSTFPVIARPLQMCHIQLIQKSGQSKMPAEFCRLGLRIPMPRTILFLCSGNYYRSRFAELVFNHLARRDHLDWRATSRALVLELGACNVGPISLHTREAVLARGIALADPVRIPIQCAEADLSSADRVIAVKEAEHRPMLTRKFPDWPDKVEYWHVHDLDAATPDQALTEIEEKVTALVEQLKREQS